MSKKKRVREQAKPSQRAVDASFAAFVAQPHIAAALLVFALIALFLSILEFSSAIGY